MIPLNPRRPAMRPFTALLWTLAILATPATARAADFHVAPGGDDGNPGTKEKPFATLAAAPDAVRQRIGKGMTSDLLIEIAPGRYYHSEPVRFDERDGGRDGHTVVVKVNQNDAGYVPLTEGRGNFWCTVGLDQLTKLGEVDSVPGLPLEQTSGADRLSGVAMEVRIDSVERPVVGTFRHGKAEVDARMPVTGAHDVYLVFPRESVRSVNWFQFR